MKQECPPIGVYNNADNRRVRMEELRDKLWVVQLRRIYLFVSQIYQKFSVDIHWTPACRYMSVYHSKCQAFSCSTQELGMENLWENPEVLLKLFIHHTRSPITCLILSINSLRPAHTGDKLGGAAQQNLPLAVIAARQTKLTGDRTLRRQNNLSS